jgi:hypothetical protein
VIQQRDADIGPRSFQALRDQRSHDDWYELPSRIGEVRRAVERVRVEVGVAAAQADRILAQEPLPRGSGRSLLRLNNRESDHGEDNVYGVPLTDVRWSRLDGKVLQPSRRDAACVFSYRDEHNSPTDLIHARPICGPRS